MIKLVCILFIAIGMFPKNKIKQSGSETWEKINETTWTKNNGWAGEGYTFFETKKGVKSCITQLYGSGVCVVSPLTYYKVEIKHDTILLLFNHLPTHGVHKYQKIDTLILQENRLKTADGKYSFSLFSKTPWVYDFEKKSCDTIAIEKLKNMF